MSFFSITFASAEGIYSTSRSWGFCMGFLRINEALNGNRWLILLQVSDFELQ